MMEVLHPPGAGQVPRLGVSDIRRRLSEQGANQKHTSRVLRAWVQRASLDTRYVITSYSIHYTKLYDV